MIFSHDGAGEGRSANEYVCGSGRGKQCGNYTVISQNKSSIGGIAMVRAPNRLRGARAALWVVCRRYAAVREAARCGRGRPAPQRAGEAPTRDPWWKNAVIYEIYPRSFQDSNGDGVGDLNGITERLDYLRDLGVDAIWISPMYPSPQVDFGYDICGLRNIDPQYGTLADFDRLRPPRTAPHSHHPRHGAQPHLRSAPMVYRVVPLQDNPKHDWYVWRDGKTDSSGKRLPPNNWQKRFRPLGVAVRPDP